MFESNFDISKIYKNNDLKLILFIYINKTYI